EALVGAAIATEPAEHRELLLQVVVDDVFEVRVAHGVERLRPRGPARGRVAGGATIGWRGLERHPPERAEMHFHPRMRIGLANGVEITHLIVVRAVITTDAARGDADSAQEHTEGRGEVFTMPRLRLEQEC